MTKIIFDDGRCFTALGNSQELAVLSILRFGEVPRLHGARYAMFYVHRGQA